MKTPCSSRGGRNSRSKTFGLQALHSALFWALHQTSVDIALMDLYNDLNIILAVSDFQKEKLAGIFLVTGLDRLP